MLERISSLMANIEAIEKKNALTEQKLINQDIKINEDEQKIAQYQAQIQTMLRSQKMIEEKIQLKNIEEDVLNRKLKTLEEQLSKAKTQIMETEAKIKILFRINLKIFRK
jgi:hypothetical protein